MQRQTKWQQRLAWQLRHPFRWQDPYQYFSEGDRHVVDMAIKEARSHTVAEIRLMVLGAASNQYWTLPAFLALLLAVGVHWYLAHYPAGASQPSWWLEVVLLATFLILYPLLGQVLPTAKTRIEEVARATDWLAQQHQAGWTKGECGLLIVLCLLEDKVGLWLGDRLEEVAQDKHLRELMFGLKCDLHNPDSRAARLSDNIKTIGFYLRQRLPAEETSGWSAADRITIQLTPHHHAEQPTATS